MEKLGKVPSDSPAHLCLLCAVLRKKWHGPSDLGKAIPGKYSAVGGLLPQDASLLRPADVETVAARSEEWFQALATKMDWQNRTIDAHLGDSDASRQA
jgi:hypothetical protein